MADGTIENRSGSAIEEFSRRLFLFVLTAWAIFGLEQAIRAIGIFTTRQSIWWPTNGIALALLVRSKRTRWAETLGGVLLGSLLGQLHRGTPLSIDLANFLANLAGLLAAAALLPRYLNLDHWIQRPRLVTRFIAAALILSPALSSTILASFGALF